MKKLKPIPQFKSESEEKEFWSVHDSSGYIDWNSAKKVKFPNLKPSTETISIRLPIFLLESIKVLANSKDITYQALIKVLLSDRVNEGATRLKRKTHST